MDQAALQRRYQGCGMGDSRLQQNTVTFQYPTGFPQVSNTVCLLLQMV
ncbi:hypothetical protein FHW88_004867 [Mucilaginibacter sp. SG538B]|nr:hypothetical protein [Mucilaginibacter sp. SG538B]NVM66549.1 hypothetical protein [Mucilaginibacter sp. SG538B]